jgi:tRNA G37 N-methylase Trm5
VPGLEGKLEPHYGVYTPTRYEYLSLLGAVDPKGKSVFDLGTGTGVLSFIFLQRGAVSAIGTDVEPAAIACARANAERLGLAERFTALETDGFPRAPRSWWCATRRGFPRRRALRSIAPSTTRAASGWSNSSPGLARTSPKVGVGCC